MMLTSDRLAFRSFVEEDFPLYRSVFTNERVMRYAYNDRFIQEEECRVSFDNVLRNSQSEQDWPHFEFAVFILADRRFAGYADIEVHKANITGGCGEIGYFLLPECWGKGYATEIAIALIDFCFNELNLHRVQARCNANNARSESVMKKAGMTWEGEARKVRFKDGRWDNEKSYGILKEEWLACAASGPSSSAARQNKERVMRIHHAAIYTSDLERLREFYVRYFGGTANQKYYNPGNGFSSYFIRFAVGAELELMSMDSGLIDGGRNEMNCGYSHIAFSAGSNEDVDALAERLKRDGYAIISGPRQTGDGHYEACALDPDGNRVEIAAEG